MQKQIQSFNIQKLIIVVAIFLFIIKIVAWYITNSVAILTDTLESTVNVVSGFLGLYSLYLSAQEADEGHPYGHGKVEYISAGIEGSLIFFAGIFIVYEAIHSLFSEHSIQELDIGIYLISLTGFINYGIGFYAEKKGRENNSIALIGSAKHLKSDAYTTVGILLGLILIYLTGIGYIDSIVAIIFSFIIMFTGIKIIRQSIAGIMDEADESILLDLLRLLNENRSENWIDIHNLRVIHYGNLIHIDCHVTMPWYWTVYRSQTEINSIHKLVDNKFNEHIELFVLSEACVKSLCKSCIKIECEERKDAFFEKEIWTLTHIRNDNVF